MPATAEEMREASLAFYDFAKFPGVIGAIDCSHVRFSRLARTRPKTIEIAKAGSSLTCKQLSTRMRELRTLLHAGQVRLMMPRSSTIRDCTNDWRLANSAIICLWMIVAIGTSITW